MLVLNYTEWTRHRLAMVRRHLEEWNALLAVERERRMAIGSQHRHQFTQLVATSPHEKARIVVKQMGEIAMLNQQHRILRQQLKARQQIELAVLARNERTGIQEEPLPY